MNETLTVIRRRPSRELRRSLGCTKIIGNMMGSIRRTCRNVKRRRNAARALRWTAAGIIEAAKGFRKLKAHKQLPELRAALDAHKLSILPNADLVQPAKVAYLELRERPSLNFNISRDIPQFQSIGP
jgi:hypothetical protein